MSVFFGERVSGLERTNGGVFFTGEEVGGGEEVRGGGGFGAGGDGAFVLATGEFFDVAVFVEGGISDEAETRVFGGLVGGDTAGEDEFGVGGGGVDEVLEAVPVVEVMFHISI